MEDKSRSFSAKEKHGISKEKEPRNTVKYYFWKYISKTTHYQMHCFKQPIKSDKFYGRQDCCKKLLTRLQRTTQNKDCMPAQIRETHFQCI